VDENRAAPSSGLAVEARPAADRGLLAEAAIRAMQDGLVAFDMDGTVVLVNESGAMLTGFSASRDAPVTPSQLSATYELSELDGRPVPVEQWPFARVLRGEGFVDWELRRRRRDGGDERILSFTGTPVRDARGEQVLGLAVARDVTEQRRAEEALRESEILLGMALDAAGAVAFLWDPETGRMRTSGDMERVFGRPSVESSEQAFAMIHPDDRERHRATVERAARTGGPYTTQFRIVRADDGRTAWIEDHGNRVLRGAHGRPLVVGLAFDITSRKHAEEELRAAERRRIADEHLARTNELLRALAARLQQVREEEKARLARDLHDELGQLLSCIKIQVRSLEQWLDTAGVVSGAGAMLERAVEASTLVDETIAAARRIAFELRPTTLDRLGLGAALQEEARRFGERTGIVAVAQVPDALPRITPEVATALYRIAQEALTNVLRHAAATRCSVRLDVVGDSLRVEIEDDGRGVGPAAVASPQALGLLGMSERARELGGEVSVARGAELRGTLVTAVVPLAAGGRGA
jgi:PAS domain S-box-containing protein